jgi:hypothetical protein
VRPYALAVCLSGTSEKLACDDGQTESLGVPAESLGPSSPIAKWKENAVGDDAGMKVPPPMAMIIRPTVETLRSTRSTDTVTNPMGS